MANYESWAQNYDSLGVGIVNFAIGDYTSTIKSLARYYNKLEFYLNEDSKPETRYQRIGDICLEIYHKIWNLKEIESFFDSEWAKSLTELDVEYLFKETKRKLRQKGYKVEIMGLTVNTDDKGVKIYAKEREGNGGKFTTYSVGISSKNQQGEWINGYMPCRFKKGVSVANKTKVKIKNSFFCVSKTGDKTYPFLMITDYEVLEEGETAGKDADEFIKIPEGTDEETPFL